ncbi:hypothetical protein D9757_001673 [Collybiopsis confluens]|uniref:Uncharacterized protein n=1 Tax=Collybiopsis confluens TaxID=2823264 RepID=A0A8H5MFA2_9AGAR|nr:hypothetical protein D9757_001673 [Collybiopsis confluens]
MASSATNARVNSPTTKPAAAIRSARNGAGSIARAPPPSKNSSDFAPPSTSAFQSSGSAGKPPVRPENPIFPDANHQRAPSFDRVFHPRHHLPFVQLQRPLPLASPDRALYLPLLREPDNKVLNTNSTPSVPSRRFNSLSLSPRPARTTQPRVHPSPSAPTKPTGSPKPRDLTMERKSEHSAPTPAQVLDFSTLNFEVLGQCSPIHDDLNLPPDHTDISPVERNAVKSGYGSVFGFNLASKPKNSVAITEASSLDRSQSVSSTASTFSIDSTKTVSRVPAASQRSVAFSPPLLLTAAEIPVSSSPSMLQTPLFPPQTLEQSPESLDVYHTLQYLRSSVPPAELRSRTSSTASSTDLSNMSAILGSHAPLPPSQSIALSTPPMDHNTQKLPKGARGVPAAVVIPLFPSESDVLFKSKSPELSRIPPYPAPASAFTNRQTSREEPSSNVRPRSPSITPSPPGTSSGKRYASSLTPNLSPSSPFGLPIDTYLSHGSTQVNLKQLLSKPAPPGNSSASESETNPVPRNSRSMRRIERIEKKNEKQRIEAVTRERAMESDGDMPSTLLVGSRERDRVRIAQWETERQLLRDRNLSIRPATAAATATTASTAVEAKERSSLGSRLVRSASWSRSREREVPEKSDKRPKNVLKRRPSAISNPPEASPSMKEFPYSSFAPSYTGTMLPVTSGPRQTKVSGGLKPPATMPSSSRGSSPIPDDKRRSVIPQSALLKQGLIVDDSASVTSGTSPAQEIMFAYRQQQEREKIRAKDRNERAREKQRERELWQLEEEYKRRRGTVSGTSSQDGAHMLPKIKHTKSATSPDATPPNVPANHSGPSRVAAPSNQSTARTPEPSNEHELADDDERSGPYFTVLGESKRIMAVDGTEIEESHLADFSWSTSNLAEGLSSSIGVGLGQPSSSHPGSEESSPFTQTWSRSASVSVGKPSSKNSSFGVSKSLTRKMSGRLAPSRKDSSLNAPGIGISSSPSMTFDGRTSLQERRAVPRRGSNKGEKQSLRLSMDEIGLLSTASPTLLESSTSRDEAQSVTAVSKSPLSPLASPTHTGGNKRKIWNILKRMSTGGLRDNYRLSSADSSPRSPLPLPPVPALPKEYSKELKGKNDRDVAHKPETNSIPAALQSSGAGSRIPAPSNRPNRSLETPTSTSTKPSTATRSSSPISSSDIGSSKFFPRSQSQRSSTSSLGEQIPPVPGTSQGVQLQQHILPPSELYQLHLNFEQIKDNHSFKHNPSNISSQSMSAENATRSTSNVRMSLKLQTQRLKTTSAAEEWRIVPTPKEEIAAYSLPVPRRRKEMDIPGDNIVRLPVPSSDDTSSSTTAPSLTDASNLSFSSSTHRSSMSQFTMPPSLPSKSPKRAATSSGLGGQFPTPSSPLLFSTASMDGHRGLLDERAKSEAEKSSRRILLKSIGPGVTSDTQPSSRDRQRTTGGFSNSKTSASTSTRASYIPRAESIRPQINSYRTYTLSEKEKAEKWDALLEKSKNAGGTLHLNGSLDRLASDRLQFSTEELEEI